MEGEEKRASNQASAGSWEQVEALLEDWRRRAYAAQAAHYASANLFRRLNYIVGIPATVFASIVGSAIFGGDLKQGETQTYVVASVSIVAAVLSGLQTFLRFLEQATNHATAADWYSAVRRDIEGLLYLPAESRGTPKDCIDKIRKEMNRVSQDAPELSVKRWQREAKRFGVKEPLAPP